MLIDTATNPTPRAPEERNVAGDEYATSARSAPPEQENLFELVFYKHYVPTGRWSWFENQENKKLTVWYTEKNKLCLK